MGGSMVHYIGAGHLRLEHLTWDQSTLHGFRAYGTRAHGTWAHRTRVPYLSSGQIAWQWSFNLQESGCTATQAELLACVVVPESAEGMRSTHRLPVTDRWIAAKTLGTSLGTLGFCGTPVEKH